MNKKLTHLLIEQVMTRSPHSIGQEQTLAKAKEMMHSLGVRHLPVKHAGKLTGIITQRDIDFALRVDHQAESRILVADALTEEVYSVTPQQSVAHVAQAMAEKRIGCAVVVDDHHAVIGIFTAVDACRVLGEVLSG